MVEEVAREGGQWANWAECVRCTPKEIASPSGEEEIGERVRGAAQQGLAVRVAGAGHSFTPLVETDGLLLTLENHTGIESVDQDACTATVRTGTRIHDLSLALLDHGLALRNQGDIDVQTLAGALSTGTHGTGPALGNLSTHPVALRLVTATGDTIECTADSDPDLFRAARVSLGSLGVLSSATLGLMPAYRLHEKTERCSPEAGLEALDARIEATRHFEFFWMPTADTLELKSLALTDEPPNELQDRKYERIGWSAHIISSVREMKFFEMEYSVPAEFGPDCFRAVRARMKARHADVMWPVEYRTLAADDAFLSPAHDRATVTISVHQDGRLPFREFFRDVEPIFWEHGGRPHWGKIHTLGAEALARLYPCWDRFAAVRKRLDPSGRFMNPHLREVLGK